MKELSSCLCPSSLCLVMLLTALVFSKVEFAQGFYSQLQFPNQLSWSNRTQTRPRPRSDRVLSVINFGAKGDGFTDDTQALKDAWEVACSNPRRTIMELPFGSSFITGPIDFSGPCRSKLTLVIAGTILAPEDPLAWSGLNPRKWLYFHGVSHLTVEGRGTINGMGHEWWARSCKINSTIPCSHAPTAITFHRCKNLMVRDLYVVNSQQMHIAFMGCRRVMASNLIVIAPASSPNTDGIHISASQGVQVNNTIISTGDDCISIVSNTSRVSINNIACGPGHGISIGSLGKSNSWSRVDKILVDGAFLTDTQNGVRIKTWQGGTGFASDITFKNVLMINVSNPIIVDQFYCDSQTPCANQTEAVKVENISFIHIIGTSATEESIRFACSDTCPCEGLYLEDIHLMPMDSESVSRSFCWEANGSSVGPVFPSPCFLDNQSVIMQKVQPDSATQSI